MRFQVRLDCSRCLVHRVIDAQYSDDARRIALTAGWTLDAVQGDRCSKCAPVKVPT